MCRSRAPLALFALVLATRLLSPAPAVAGSFAQQWSLSGWDFLEDLGNTDSDPQRELLFASKADGHAAIVDGLTGAIEKEFPAFAANNSQLTVQDVDGDGHPELFFARPPNGPVTSLVTAYHWNGTTYTTLFSHTDPTTSWSLINLRGATTYDAIETSATDVRVRDMSGTIIFQASTAIPGWSGDAPTYVAFDIDHDGLAELGVVEHNFTTSVKVHFFNYAGGFTPAWTVTGWEPAGETNSDGDPQNEIIMINWTDGHYGLFDGVSGAMDVDFPAFTVFDGSSLTSADVDGDGRSELFLSRPLNLPTTPLFAAYKWVSGSYTQMFSHTDPVDSFSLVHIRNAAQYDVLEEAGYPNPGPAPGDVRVRDLGGNVLFRASTQLAGWSGNNLQVIETDTNHDGIEELAIQDNTTARFVRYSGAFVQSWSTSAWSLQAELANVDGGSQTELVAASAADHHYALLDTPSGAPEQEFPAFTTDGSYLLPIDVDNDGRLELFFDRFTTTPQLFTGYDWTPSGYVTLLSHNDEIEGLGSAHFRNPLATEFAELAANDLRVRDLSGLVLFRASTDLPGWTGTNRDMQPVDVNNDGISEFLAIDDGAARLVRYTGSTAVTNPGEVPTFQLLGSAPNPFRTGTAFRFTMPATGTVGIRVFDASGRLVRRLDQPVSAGLHEVRWDGRDERGHAVPSGMLFYEVTAGGIRRSGRMVRLDR